MGQIAALGKRRMEFWRYSSRNQKGHRQHPMTHARREFILIHWEAGWTEDSIALRLRIDVDTVGRHLKEARKAGDPRAAIRHAATLHALEMAK
jgi:DNA-binding transcriptional regulator LsrR (DeoR family)